jgi:putative oxidoreductase
MIQYLHNSIFTRIERFAGDWFIGLAARFTFSSVLLFYFINSARTKIEEGLFGFLSIKESAYYQILPSVVEAYQDDVSAIPTIPYHLIVMLGTYAEFILPVLILLGLFTRIAALGMIGFIAVQTYVDINFHGVGAETIGGMFDRFQDSAIADQRLMWLFLLLVLLIKGAGTFSLDNLLLKRRWK